MSAPRAVAFDIIALVVFAVIARWSHPPFTLLGLLDAFWPWAVGALAGWCMLALADKPGRLGIWAQGGVVWLSTVIVGMLAWAAANGRFPAVSFVIVAAVMSALFLFGWRAISSITSRRRHAASH